MLKKDLFDIYLLSKEEYNIDIFNSAIINTFYVRNTELTGDICVEAESILSFFRIKELFESYVKKNKFTNGLEYEECKEPRHCKSAHSAIGHKKIHERHEHCKEDECH